MSKCYRANIKDYTCCNKKFKQSTNVTIDGYPTSLKYKDNKLDIVSNNYFFLLANIDARLLIGGHVVTPTMVF